jgi:copper homeostasis protein
MLLEVVVFNFRSALVAAAAGADRLELCDNFFEGGTTPSHGMVSYLRDKLNIPLFAMVRPRGGDFLYSAEEIDVMKKDIQLFRQLGCEGIVTGCLNKDGTVDTDLLSQLVKIAAPAEVTFHRAFDRVRDQLTAMEQIIQCGCKRILTSGGRPLACEGTEIITELIDKAGGRIGIIPGGGINSNTISQLVSTGAVEFHTPARKMIATEMDFVNDRMNENLESVCVDENEIMLMKQSLMGFHWESSQTT